MIFFQYAKYLLLNVLTSYNAATYAGLSVADASARAVHTITYVALSRAGLQLPVSVFIPPPRLLTATDAVLYVAPNAVAAWVDGVDVLQEVSKVLDLGYRAVICAVAVVVEHHELITHALARAPPPFLTASQSAYVSVRWSPRNESSLAFPTYPNSGRLAFIRFPNSFRLPTSLRPSKNLSTVYHPLFPVHGLPLTDLRSPISAVVGLEQCTPYRVLPIRMVSTDLDMDIDLDTDTSFVLPGERVLNNPDSSKDVVIYKGEDIIIIHVKTCLAALFALYCTAYIGYVVLRLVFRIVRWIFSRAYMHLAFAFGWITLLLEIMARPEMDICDKLLLLVAATQIHFAPQAEYRISSSDPGRGITPSASCPSIPSLAPLPVSAQPSSAAPSKSAKNKNKKKKIKADLDESAKVNPASVPLPDDDDEWATSTSVLPPADPTPTSPVDMALVIPLPEDNDEWLAEPTESLLTSPPSGLLVVVDDSPSIAPIHGASSTSADEPTEDDGAEWTQVTRRHKLQRSPVPAPAPESQSNPGHKAKKTRRGVRGGRGRERAQKQA